MDSTTHFISAKGRDITADVREIRFQKETGNYKVTFLNNSVYVYQEQSVRWLQNPKPISPDAVRVSHRGRELFDIQKIRVFDGSGERYWHICFGNGLEKTYDGRDLHVEYSCLKEKRSADCLGYLREIASIHDLKCDDGTTLLKKQYDRLKFVNSTSAMAVYLNPKEHEIRTWKEEGLIFPFGGNASQFKAVENALENQISVIQGPPGTGKTQTILNIIANLLIRGKRVQVVSNNDSATMNVAEKLSRPEYNLGFLTAHLGKGENKRRFIEEQSGRYPGIEDWRMDRACRREVMDRVRERAEELRGLFAMEERLAEVRCELDSIGLEIRYFQQYCEDHELTFKELSLRRGADSRIFLKLWQECGEFSERDRAVSFWFKIKNAFLYGLMDWSIYRQSLPEVITFWKKMFYDTHKRELEAEREGLEQALKTADLDRKMKELTKDSMDCLRAGLYERYGGRKERQRFREEDLWKNGPAVLKEYPIVLSTAFSSVSCLNGVTYDYLIMDEASQADVVTGALALSGAENAVIVGDLKQLPRLYCGSITAVIQRLSDSVMRNSMTISW